ncbi:NAD(P)-dependent oxidoreductase [Granulicoccus sp. GXG6511]|uniref:NAD(P)-dependent oxidoreductase n=1 Tax=Granulicoccus sp. GXG6511 TaxID=3381351 RepID=UPI003D7CD916
MKITIIGGSRGTGGKLAEIARDAGHQVTVVSRSHSELDGVERVIGSALAPAIARQSVAGADAVVVTVGGAKGVPKQRAEITRNVIAAMQAEGVRRLVVQSSVGAGDSASQLPVPLRLLMSVLLAKPVADHTEQEAAANASGLDWTIVRPTGLTDKPGAGTWRALEVSDAGHLRGSIPRADLAACLLRVLEDDATIGKAIGVSSA